MWQADYDWIGHARRPVVLLLADAGFSGFGSLIATSVETATNKAESHATVYQCLD